MKVKPLEHAVCVEEGTTAYSRILETGGVGVSPCHRANRASVGHVSYEEEAGRTWLSHTWKEFIGEEGSSDEALLEKQQGPLQGLGDCQSEEQSGKISVH